MKPMTNNTKKLKIFSDNFNDASFPRTQTLLILIFIVFIEAIIYHFTKNKVIDHSDIIESIVPIYTGQLFPEYFENIAYMSATILTPIVAFISAILIGICQGKKYFHITKYIIQLEIFLCKFSCIILLIAIYVCFSNSDLMYLDYKITQNIFNILFSFVVFIIIYITYESKYKIAKNILLTLLIVISIILIILSCYISFLPSQNDYSVWLHFNAYFESVVAVIYGKTLLVDGYKNQYGFYPYLLLPIFKFIELNVKNISIVMVILTLISYLSNLGTLLILVKNKIIAFLAFINIIFYANIFCFSDVKAFDYYYQYTPHRYLFPSVVIFLFTLYIKEMNVIKQKIIYCLLFVISTLGLVWNLDTGVIVYLACFIGFMFKFFCDFKIHKFLKLKYYIVFLIGVPLSFVFILQTITFIRSNTFINLLEIFSYQKLFYNIGMAMLPMPPFHPWNLLILVYVITIVICMNYLFKKIMASKISDNNIFVIMFFLSVMGVGLFSYYQGRSHDLVFYKVISCGFIVLALLIDNHEVIFEFPYKKIKYLQNFPLYSFYLSFLFSHLVCCLTMKK